MFCDWLDSRIKEYARLLLSLLSIPLQRELLRASRVMEMAPSPLDSPRIDLDIPAPKMEAEEAYWIL
jgi:hypothetical protein